MSKKKALNKKVTAIIGFNVFLIACALAGATTGTLAWFNASRTTIVETGTFTVVGRDDVDFDFYYLDHFTVDATEKYGNYNRYDAEHGKFAGYETSYPNAVFTQATIVDGAIVGTPNPTNITDLWPAHRLTFAIVIKGGTVNRFTLANWSETVNEDIKVLKDGEDIPLSLSWATNMYGKAYSVEDTGDAGISATEVNAKYGEATTGYRAQFNSLTDKFNYDEDEPALPEKEEVEIIDTVPANASGHYTVMFFTLEFSNDPSTWYVEDGEYYTKDSVYGNSNCYEKLKLEDLEFMIK